MIAALLFSALTLTSTFTQASCECLVWHDPVYYPNFSGWKSLTARKAGQNVALLDFMIDTVVADKSSEAIIGESHTDRCTDSSVVELATVPLYSRGGVAWGDDKNALFATEPGAKLCLKITKPTTFALAYVYAQE